MSSDVTKLFELHFQATLKSEVFKEISIVKRTIQILTSHYYLTQNQNACLNKSE